VPNVEEILAYVVPHLKKGTCGGQFWSGLRRGTDAAGELLVEAVHEIRKRTKRGVINLNTNASRPQIVEKLCEADWTHSRQPEQRPAEMYQKYFSPRGYGFNEVMESIRTAAAYNRGSR
jgi:hypothetical protein